MKIHCITGTPPPELARALVGFEKEFRYPLGPSGSFSISHGEDYPRFFRGMGDAKIYLAEIAGEIVGSLAVVGRHVLLANETSIPAIYVGDAKVVEKFRGRTVLGRLSMAARDEILAAGYKAAFSVVMAGSTPSDQHTGRLGIPKFDELGKIAILRFDTRTPLKAFSHHHDLTIKPSHRPHGGDPGTASEIPPHTLAVDGGSGILIDTRHGKRLWRSDGSEMMSAHLTELRFTSAFGLFNLIQAAIKISAELGYPGLFTALPADFSIVGPLLDASSGTATIAVASVYGTGLPDGHWMMNTSEI
ncbi:MAG: hypothetical protein ABIT37_19700 [Luteolibacter sp.]